MKMSEVVGVPITVACQGDAIPRYEVIGVIESLRALCEAEAPDGDLSKFTLSELAAWCTVGGGEDAASRATDVLWILVNCGYLDTVTDEEDTAVSATATSMLWPRDGEQAKTPKKKRKRRTAKKTEPTSVEIPKELRDHKRFMRVWEEWHHYRDAKGRPLTPSIEKKQLSVLGSLPADRAAEVIQHSIDGGHTGLLAESPNESYPRVPTEGASATFVKTEAPKENTPKEAV